MLRERRANALDAAALLIDQDRRFRIIDAVAQGRDEITDLFFLTDVAAEENEAPGAFAGEEAALLRRQGKAFAARDECL